MKEFKRDREKWRKDLFGNQGLSSADRCASPLFVSGGRAAANADHRKNIDQAKKWGSIQKRDDNPKADRLDGDEKKKHRQCFRAQI